LGEAPELGADRLDVRPLAREPAAWVLGLGPRVSEVVTKLVRSGIGPEKSSSCWARTWCRAALTRPSAGPASTPLRRARRQPGGCPGLGLCLRPGPTGPCGPRALDRRVRGSPPGVHGGGRRAAGRADRSGPIGTETHGTDDSGPAPEPVGDGGAPAQSLQRLTAPSAVEPHFRILRDGSLDGFLFVHLCEPAPSEPAGGDLGGGPGFGLGDRFAALARFQEGLLKPPLAAHLPLLAPLRGSSAASPDQGSPRSSDLPPASVSWGARTCAPHASPSWWTGSLGTTPRRGRSPSCAPGSAPRPGPPPHSRRARTRRCAPGHRQRAISHSDWRR